MNDGGLKWRFERWLITWAELAATVIALVTFGSVRPSWEFDLMARHTKRRLRANIKDGAKK